MLNDPSAQVVIVGNPCQINGLKKVMALTKEFQEFYKDRDTDYPHWPKRVFSVAVFCMGNFSPKTIPTYVENNIGLPLEKVTKMNISSEGFRAYTDKKISLRKIPELSKYLRGSCKQCTDFIGDFADISVGSIGSDSGWSTVILRTKQAKDLFKKLVTQDFIEVSKNIHSEDLNNTIDLKKNIIAKNSIKLAQEKGFSLPFVDLEHDDDLEKFIQKGHKKDFMDLEKEILQPGFCVACGACALVCPCYNIEILEDNRPYCIRECLDNCGCCYIACPRTHSFKKILLKDQEEPEIFAAKAKNPSPYSQDGGIITALIAYNLENNIFSKAIVAIADSRWRVYSFITNDSSFLKTTAGSKYASIPQLYGLKFGR